MKKLIYFTLILCVFCLPAISYGEVEIGIYESDISVETWPENPSPYDNVEIKLTSYATDLNLAMIEWRSGNKVIMSGYGKTTYSFTALGPNTSTVFQVVVIPQETKERITKDIIISPSEIELLWEAVDSYTPPFYKGKSFPTQEGVIKVVAVPNSNTIKSGKGKVSYKWSRNDKSIEEVSGYGKDSYLFVNSVLKDKEIIKIKASATDSNYNASREIEIPIYNPTVIFYKKSPTEGVLYNKSINSDFIFDEDEITIVAAPYFLAIKGNENNFTYKWKINGDDIDTPSKKTEITVRPTSRGGHSTIGVVFESMTKLYQKITGQLKLNL